MDYEIKTEEVSTLGLQNGRWYNAAQLTFQIQGNEKEFTFGYVHGQPRVSGRLQFGPLIEMRFPVSSASISLGVELADRTLVARLSQPVYLAPSRKVSLIIGSPVWLTFNSGAEKLTSQPVIRMSDTWFGPSTIVGELCYSSRTRARREVDDYPSNYWKALTPIELVNESDEAMQIERVNIPIPNLALYQSPTRYWTSPIRITRTEGGDGSEIKIRSARALPEKDLVNVAMPRTKISSGVVLKAMGLLFG